MVPQAVLTLVQYLVFHNVNAKCYIFGWMDINSQKEK